MLPYFTERFGNPSSRSHAFGQEARAAVEEARAQVAALVGRRRPRRSSSPRAPPSPTTSRCAASRGRSRERGRHVVTTAIEHAAVLEPCRTLEREGFEVTRVEVGGDGVVDVGRRRERPSAPTPSSSR